MTVPRDFRGRRRREHVKRVTATDCPQAHDTA
jgi:hypothetical protein